MSKNNAFLPNKIPGLSDLFDERGLPKKFVTDDQLCQKIQENLRIKDRQEFVNRYIWKDLPVSLSSEEIERMLYLRGQLVFFSSGDELIDEYNLMPFALDGGLDFYGRYAGVHPVPYANGVEDYKNDGLDSKATIQRQANYLAEIKLSVVYHKNQIARITDKSKVGVILWDYTRGVSENIIPRSTLQEEIIKMESLCIPYMRTALKNSTGIMGLKVKDESEKTNVLMANASLDAAALIGWRYVPIIATLELQQLTDGNIGKVEEFMQAMQSVDNFRVSLIGISNGGVFEKKAHMLGSEQEMNETKNESPITDGLNQRKKFCELINEIYGINASVEINQDMQTEETDQGPLDDEVEHEEGEEND